MIELTQQQRQAVEEGKAVPVSSTALGVECVLVRADVFERMRAVLEDDEPDMRDVSRLVERNMREDDANDPLLAGYQEDEAQP